MAGAKVAAAAVATTGKVPLLIENKVGKGSMWLLNVGFDQYTPNRISTTGEGWRALTAALWAQVGLPKPAGLQGRHCGSWGRETLQLLVPRLGGWHSKAAMSIITFDIPDATLAELHLSPQALGVEMRMAAAARLYAQHRISIHQAAQLAGIDEFAFRQRLGDYGVPLFDLTREELEAELA